MTSKRISKPAEPKPNRPRIKQYHSQFNISVMDNNPTPEQLAFLTMFKSCLESGFLTITAKAIPSHVWTQDGDKKQTVNTATEICIYLGDDKWHEVQLTHDGY